MTTPIITALDHLLSIETPNMRWLREAAEKLREQERTEAPKEDTQ